MKNKVLRLAVVAILVVAMTLTMAACNKPEPSPSPSQSTAPSESTAPSQSTAPSESTKPSESAAPSPSTAEKTDADKLKEEFGIEVVTASGVYAQKDGIVKTAASTFGFFLKGVDELKKKSNYEVAATIAIDYDGNGASTNKVSKTRINMNGAYALTPYATSGIYDATTGGVVAAALGTKFATAYGYALDGKDAGTYTAEIVVTITDKSATFAKFGHEVEDSQEFTVEATLTIERKPVVIVALDNAVKVDNKTTTQYPSATAGTVYVDYVFSDYGSHTFSGYDIVIEEASSYNTNKEGSVGLKIALAKTGGYDNGLTEDNTLDLEEFNETSVNYTYSLKDATRYYLSAYDFNAIGDVITSALDIKVGDTAYNQYKLTMARYEALSDAQKAYFARANDFATANAFDIAINYNTYPVVSGTPQVATQTTCTSAQTDAQYESDYAYYKQTVTSSPSASPTTWTYSNTNSYTSTSSELYSWLTRTMAGKVAESDAIKAWTLACISAGWADASGSAVYTLESFSVKDSVAVNAYNKVDEYFNSLDATTKNYLYSDSLYISYYDASGAFVKADVDAAKELIAGALGAYNRALVDGSATKVLYTDTDTATTVARVTKWVKNAEVISLTNQARAAYDKVAGGIKTTFDNTAVVTTNLKDNDSSLIYEEVLVALENMNAAVEAMEQVINYVNIEDYKTANSFLYARLNALVYGVSSGNDFFGNGSNYVCAVSDILKNLANPVILPEVVAEYKGWIDASIALETYKTELIASLDAMIAEEFTAENYDSWSASYLSKVQSKNDLYKALVKVIKTESTSDIGFVETDDAYSSGKTYFNVGTGKKSEFDGYLTGIVSDFAAEVTSTANSAIGNFDEVNEAFEEMFDIDKIFSIYYKYAKLISASFTPDFTKKVDVT